MISFDTFTQRLAQGQLKNTSAVDDTDKDQIIAEYIPTILSLTNQGLVDISSRFPLITKQIDLIFETGTYLYPLHSDGVGNYLDESLTDVFDDNLVKVLDVFDEDGKAHSIDTDGHIMTPTYDSLRFTSAKMTELGEKIRIRYQAKHPGIDENANINIPPNLETALQLFVASLYLSHMNGSDHTVKGDNYFATYLRHIGEDEHRNNSSTSEIDYNSRFDARGFV